MIIYIYYEKEAMSVISKGIIVNGQFLRCSNHDELAERLVRNEEFRSRFEQEDMNPLDFLIFRCKAVKIGNEGSPTSKWAAVYSASNYYAEKWVEELEEKEEQLFERIVI